VNGARLYIEIDGKWQIPDYMLGLEVRGADHPDWTKEEVEEEEDKYLPF